jgi:hypothetical protein
MDRVRMEDGPTVAGVRVRREVDEVEEEVAGMFRGLLRDVDGRETQTPLLVSSGMD